MNIHKEHSSREDKFFLLLDRLARYRQEVEVRPVPNTGAYPPFNPEADDWGYQLEED